MFCPAQDTIKPKYRNKKYRIQTSANGLKRKFAMSMPQKDKTTTQYVHKILHAGPWWETRY